MALVQRLQRKSQRAKKMRETTRRRRQPRRALAPRLRQRKRDSRIVHSSRTSRCSPKAIAAQVPPRQRSSSTSSSSRERPSCHPVSGLSSRPPNMGLAMPRIRKSLLCKAWASSKQISWRSFFRQRSSTVLLRSRPTCSQLDLALAPSEQRRGRVQIFIWSHRNVEFSSSFGLETREKVTKEKDPVQSLTRQAPGRRMRQPRRHGRATRACC